MPFSPTKQRHEDFCDFEARRVGIMRLVLKIKYKEFRNPLETNGIQLTGDSVM